MYINSRKYLPHTPPPHPPPSPKLIFNHHSGHPILNINTSNSRLVNWCHPITFSIHISVPNVPQVEIIPSYSTDSQALERLFIVTTVNQTVSGIAM